MLETAFFGTKSRPGNSSRGRAGRTGPVARTAARRGPFEWAGEHRRECSSCRDCRNKFTFRIGTFMEHSHVPPHKWLQAVHLVADGERCLSPQKLMRRLDLGSYRTAWLMAQRIREALYRRGIEKRARPATLHVVTEGDARSAREVSFDDAVQALVACPQTHETWSNGSVTPAIGREARVKFPRSAFRFGPSQINLDKQR